MGLSKGGMLTAHRDALGKLRFYLDGKRITPAEASKWLGLNVP